MKKYLVRCDMEGVSGVVNYGQAEPGGAEYAFGQGMLLNDLSALIEGLRAGGADEVVVYDEHYYGLNIAHDTLPEYVRLIDGKPPYRKDWPGGLDASFAGAALLGFHAKAETPNALLPHSYELEIRDLRLNGVSVGEIGMEAAIAGDYGVPIVLMAGDSSGAAEAKRLLPGIACVVVKKSLGENTGVCYPAEKNAAGIRAAAIDCVKNPPPVKPYTVAAPVRLEIELRESPYLETVRKLLKADLKNPQTLAIAGRTVTEVWAGYWAKKLLCQSAILTKNTRPGN